MKSYEQWLEEVYFLTLRRRKRDLNLQLGKPADDSCAVTYDAEDLMSLKHEIESTHSNPSLYYEAVDHYLRTKAEPFQAMLATWMGGAKAYVGDAVIPFNDAINWCQKASDPENRKTLAKELLALCRFLTQFSHATWEAITTTLVEILGFRSYLHYNESKRNTSIVEFSNLAQEFLSKTSPVYFESIGLLVEKIAGLPLENASRYDAIYLLGLRYMDHLMPDNLNMEKIEAFFEDVKLSLRNNIHMKIHRGTPGRQTYCVPVKIPYEIHIITGEISGWLDVESLFHELGHAFSFIFTDPSLPVEKKDFFHSAALSESYAFLFQKLSMSRLFLEEVLGVDSELAQGISGIHRAKWLTLARRYAAKLIIETRNFENHDLMESKKYYSEVMERETGFSYEPDTYLFDLMPDFYTLDYFCGFVGAAIMESYLTDKFGKGWFLEQKAYETLKEWWHGGNSLELKDFLETKLEIPFDVNYLVDDFDMVASRAFPLESLP